MYRLFLILLMMIVNFCNISQAQTSYETDMWNVLLEWDYRDSNLDYEKLSHEFDRISKENKNKWLPKYYSILMKTLGAANENPKKAIEISNGLEKEYLELEKLNPKRDEILILRGMFRSIKIAKDPETYRMTLSSGVLWDYNEALKINPNNPRAMFLSALFNLQSASFWGTDPKRYCTSIYEAKKLFEKEIKDKLEPQWGHFQVEEILNSVCD